MMSRPIELSAGDARVDVLPHVGGAIAAYTWQGRPVLRRGPDAASDVRLTACYPLVPYSNRIRDARVAFERRRHVLDAGFGDGPHPIHGLGWQRPWDVVASSAHAATLALDHGRSPGGSRAWPWPFRARQAFRLTATEERSTLIVAMSIENTGDSAFPFGLGWHPYFPRDPTTTLVFDAASIWRNDASQLPIRRVPARGRWRFASPRAIGSAPIDNVFTGWNGIATLRSPASGIATSVEADAACRFLVVFAPAGRDFVAIEPVTQETDAFNRAARGARGTGMRTLGPGESFGIAMRLTTTRAS